MDPPDPPVSVLVVEDEPDLAALYAAFLEDEFDVRTATDGRAALEAMDGTVDVVLLDRRMPGMNGDEVLGELRERGHQAAVGMLTAVEPDLDIVDMPFDDYLTKPVDKELLNRKVTVLAHRTTFEERGRELFRLASKKAALDAKEGIDTDSREYRELVDRMEELREGLDDTLDRLFDEDPSAVFRSL